MIEPMHPVPNAGPAERKKLVIGALILGAIIFVAGSQTVYERRHAIVEYISNGALWIASAVR